MPTNADMLRQALIAGVAAGGGHNEVAAGNAEERQMRLKNLLQGEAQQRDIKSLQQMQDQGMLQEGGGAKAGEVSVSKGYDPRTAMKMQGDEASKFNKVVQNEYKPINDQLSAAKDTLDALNQKNASSDKLALINEARMAAGAGGSRAIATIIHELNGGKTSAEDFQGAVNYLNNTANIPEMSDARRDALRESVFNRVTPLAQRQAQSTQRLTQLGPQLSPHADYNSVIGAYATPASQNLSQLQQMQQDYYKKRKDMSGSSISNPSSADNNPSIVQKLMSFFGKGSTPKQPSSGPTSGTPQGGPPPNMTFEQFQKWKGSQTPQGQQGP